MFFKHLKNYKEEIKKCIEDLKHKDTFYKQIPNILTFMRLVLAIPAGLLYYLNPIASICSIAFLWLTDAVDGKIARRFEIQSKLGADMDTVADKIMFLGSAIPLLANAPFLIANLVLEGIISIINTVGRLKGLDTRTVLSGKVKTVSLGVSLVFGYLANFLGLSMSMFSAMLGATAGLQVLAINDYIKAYKEMNEVKKEDVILPDDKDVEIESSSDEKSTLIEQLEREREFVLATQQPSKVYTGKKRVRKMIQEKKNNSYFG